jgi:hypothetical protein
MPARVISRRLGHAGRATFPTTRVLDDFNRADGALGSNWLGWWGDTIGTIASNQAIGAASYRSGYWAASTFVPDSETYFTVGTIANFQLIILGCRMTGLTSANGYFLRITISTMVWQIMRYIAGAYSQLATVTQTISNGDGIGISAVGNLITSYHRNGINGVWQPNMSAVNTYWANTTGNIGWDFNSAASVIGNIDDFGGGNYIP